MIHVFIKGNFCLSMSMIKGTLLYLRKAILLKSHGISIITGEKWWDNWRHLWCSRSKKDRTARSLTCKLQITAKDVDVTLTSVLVQNIAASGWLAPPIKQSEILKVYITLRNEIAIHCYAGPVFLLPVTCLLAPKADILSYK